MQFFIHPNFEALKSLQIIVEKQLDRIAREYLQSSLPV